MLIADYEMDAVDIALIKQFTVGLITTCFNKYRGLSVYDQAANGQTLWENNRKLLIFLGAIGAAH